MSDLVDPERIEEIVGVQRHPFRHMGRAVSAEQVVYILHSAECRANTPDPRECPFSLALDRGIDVEEWRQDTPVRLAVLDGRLIDAGLRIQRRYVDPARKRPRREGATQSFQIVDEGGEPK